ncbi:ARF guanine-nucleotide exchange factor GNOM-like protein [Drosera capensis]
MGRVEMQFDSNIVGQHDDPSISPLKTTSVACKINTEVGTVLAVMRRNVRWGSHFLSGDNKLEHPLIHSFKNLRKQIFTWQTQWHNVNPVLYLQPFLDVIQSDETGAPITGVALSSVYKILTLDVFDLDTVNVGNAMHFIVDAVTSCRFEVTDPASEEVVLMKILQVLLACMKSKASVLLTNQHVCIIVDTCFRVVHQAGTKSELLQRIARHTMHEVVKCIFFCLPEISSMDPGAAVDHNMTVQENGKLGNAHNYTHGLSADSISVHYDGEADSVTAPSSAAASSSDKNSSGPGKAKSADSDNAHLMKQPYGLPCMIEVLQFLCSLLDIAEHVGSDLKSNTLAFDEDVPLFALGLINSAIELGGSSFRRHPQLLRLIQDDLFFNLMRFGLSRSPLILSMVCSIVLNLWSHLRTEIRLQIEAFFSSIILRIAESRYGASYQQQEVAMEALVDFCRQKAFMVEMYANFDSEITCGNVFEDLVNLLSKSAFPVNSPLSGLNTVALDGLIAVIQAMAERVEDAPPFIEITPVSLEEYTPFWMTKCDDYNDPRKWIPFTRQRKRIKKKLMIGADHFNRGSKKGFEFLQASHLLPKDLDPQSVACFFRYTAGLDKNLIGDYLGSHDECAVAVLHEFAHTFDFHDMSLDTALRIFLETFRLPGESQKIQRVLEAFAESFYEQSRQIFVNKDAALLLSYSTIMLNTDRHNSQVKKKMTEEDFIRNNRRINGGEDLPREYLSELYHSICSNEIRTTRELGAGFQDTTPSSWIDLILKSKKAPPYIMVDSRPYLDHDMLAIMVGPTIAAISVIFDHADDEAVCQTCVEGFLAVAKVSAMYRLPNVLDDLVISLCKFTTLLTPSYAEEFMVLFSEDAKAMMATTTLFTIANAFGDHIRTGWKNILDCVLRLHEFGLLPSRVATDSGDESALSINTDDGKTSSKSSSSQLPSTGLPRRPSGLMGRFSQFLSFDTEEPNSEPTDEEVAARKRTLETIEQCHINSIFRESKFLQADSLLQLAGAIMAAGRSSREKASAESSEAAIFFLELLITITLNNRDRISLLWSNVYEHIAHIVQSTPVPCNLVEKAVFGLISFCQRLLPYKENLVDELLRSLQLVLKLDARVADAYCEQITQEIGHLVKANATHIRSQMGWRIVLSLLAMTARHPEASEAGFDTLSFVMGDGAHLLPSNFVLCVDAARQFAESRVGQAERSVHALNLMAGSVDSLVQWGHETKGATMVEDATKISQDIGEMWLRLVQGFRKACTDSREEVRNHALLSLQKCLVVVRDVCIPHDLWLQCFDLVIFPVLDELFGITQDYSRKTYHNVEGTLIITMKLLSKIFLLSIDELMDPTTFGKLWLGVLGQMEKFMKVKIRGKRSEKLQEMLPELLKNTLLVMKTGGVLTRGNAAGGEVLWDLTWSHVNNIVPSLLSEIFPDTNSDTGSDQPPKHDGEPEASKDAISLTPTRAVEPVASEG